MVELMSTTSYYAVEYKGGEYTVMVNYDINTDSITAMEVTELEGSANEGLELNDEFEAEIIEYCLSKI
jgi:hypothetical protein